MTSKSSLELDVLQNSIALCRPNPTAPAPTWAFRGSFYSVSKTAEELSVVCDEALVPADVKAEKNWRCFKVKGPLDFGLRGILASLSHPSVEVGISIFARSKFDTDNLLVKQKDFERSISTLTRSGHTIEGTPK